MGLFCANVHIRIDSSDLVRAALEDEPQSTVLDAENGWVSVYADGLREQEDGPKKLGAALSQHLGARSISFSVHDSDIARYWIHDSGRLVDEYNSWPGYFEGAAPRSTGGDLESLARLSTSGHGVRDLRRALAADRVFADDLAEDLARLLGIEGRRTTLDYRDLVTGENPLSNAIAESAAQLQSLPLDEYPPDSVALVTAAADGDVAEVTRLAKSGTSVDTVAPGRLPQSAAIAGLGVADFRPEMTPLIAAVLNRKVSTAEALLDLGADPDIVHAAHGSAVHAAAGSGRADLLELLLDHGADPERPDHQRQTPLDVVGITRQGLTFIASALESLSSLGLDQGELLDELAAEAPDADELSQCEEILRERIGGS